MICELIYAQETKENITGTFNHLTLGQFVKELENKGGYTFYYDPEHRDSLSVNIEVSQVSLDSLLAKAFRNTFYYFLVDQEEKNVFITYKRRMDAALSPVLLSISSRPGAVFRKEVIPNSEASNEERPAVKATLENKIYEIGIKTSTFESGEASLSGYVRHARTGEPLTGVSVKAEPSKSGTVTDQYGYYSLQLPKGHYMLAISGIGIRNTRRQIDLYGNGRLNIEALDQVQTLKEVVISSEKVRNIKNVQLGVEKLTLQNIKQVPTVFGEADVLRVVLTLPGVKSVGEASTGFNVRGGATDQNLILYNGATIYNPSHFFGFFSAFNPESVKDVELYKSSIPAYYGGRLSSVLEVNTRDGNKKKFTGSAGIGLLTSRFNVEGPLVKDKTSFMIGGRTTYSNWLLKALPGKAEYKGSKASFSDLDVHLSHQFNEGNSLYVTGYYSKDKSNLNSDTTYSYNNQSLSVKWKHVFGNKLFSVFTAGYDNYGYNNFSDISRAESYTMEFNINQASFKTDFNWYPSQKHTINAGVSGIYYKLNPGTFDPRGGESLIIRQDIEDERGLENALYVNDKFDITSGLSINAGIRYSIYQSLGPKTVNKYSPGLPLEEANTLESVTYGRNKAIKTYHGPEYRISARYIFENELSVKAGYNTMRQYIHMLSNTTAIAPTDIWKLSDYNIKPQYGDQFALGIYKNFKSNTIETSVEVYYKTDAGLP
ncbi:TonB-dependent receptor [Arcticibacter tournemirensis]|uniref:TonB-dependent receptor n=1 Tax=Arcticibacter tournemirensis TaxID=699437 RepID=UPI00192A4EBC|nr:carboxypeptidase-like regulatory domain-containing protein [Arcticibacter tournemirensis]